MNIKHLYYFVTVAEQLSYSKAAEKLHITQPSLSTAIKNLERIVDSPLFERNTRKISLTDAGAILYKKTMPLLSQLDILEKEMKEVKELGNGELVIGMIESVKHWLPEVIREYCNCFPTMRVKLIEVLSKQDVIDSLRKYDTHIIITNQFINEADIESVSLYEENLVLLIHQDHPLSQRDELSIKELENEPFIISTEGFQTRDDILKVFEYEQVSPSIKFEIERFETALTLVRENLGLTLIPENYLVRQNEPSIVCKKIPSSLLQRTVYVTRLKNRYLSPAINAFFQRIIGYYVQKL
ncbi:DNA-binding transcriptional regulator, LysR family [Fictibacillus solisalsi]|uniref:DNA-binding transcriptional regulator, LysR family n=1 Tax=Fictibacillus solisalsi TaxID=459525 RepID=A0A1G9VH34_9BACL|nr:LysR family transcriptional regulator [Fictibacillus solisalsi]SDM71125.1 DNA-binding transcriptional regulator, LysR family [Fictibacillus solisalsi]